MKVILLAAVVILVRGLAQTPQVDATNAAAGEFYLRVESDPEGAEITIDGKKYDEKTPAQFLLPVGRHTLVLTREGYDDKTIEIPLDKHLRFNGVLVRKAPPARPGPPGSAVRRQAATGTSPAPSRGAEQPPRSPAQPMASSVESPPVVAAPASEAASPPASGVVAAPVSAESPSAAVAPAPVAASPPASGVVPAPVAAPPPAVAGSLSATAPGPARVEPAPAPHAAPSPPRPQEPRPPGSPTGRLILGSTPPGAAVFVIHPDGRQDLLDTTPTIHQFERGGTYRIKWVIPVPGKPPMSVTCDVEMGASELRLHADMASGQVEKK